MDKFWLLVLLFLLSVHPSGVQAERLVVDQSGGGDFSTIRKAVNAADAGDEILVSPGYYKEGVIPILRPLALTGSPGQATLEGGLWWRLPAPPSQASRFGASAPASRWS